MERSPPAEPALTPTIFVMGTWGLEDTWWRPGSDFAREAAKHGVLQPVGYPPFKWSGALGGVPGLTSSDPFARFPDRQLGPWEVAGHNLWCYGQWVGGGEPVNLITHSHGLSVGAFACAYGLRVSVFLSISGPIRRDMQRVRRAALGTIERWVQVVDPEHDQVIRAGEFADGEVGWQYELPEPSAVTVKAPYGHSGLFEAQHFPAWERLGLWAYFAPPTVI